MRGRGRILQSLSKLTQESRLDDQETREEPPRTGEQRTEPISAFRGRAARLLTKLAREGGDRGESSSSGQQHLQQEQEQKPPQGNRDDDDETTSTSRSRTSSSANLSESATTSTSERAGITRSRSDLSSSHDSEASQVFAEPQSTSRACLPKVPSTSGQPIRMSLNYMTFNVAGGAGGVNSYHVMFEPNIESSTLRYQMLRTDAVKNVIGEVMHWNGTNLYLPKKLPNRENHFQSIHPASGQPVKIIVKYIKTPPEDELLCFYNSLMHKVMNRLKYVIINRQHYSPLHKIPIQQHRLEVWPGWITTIQQLDGGLKLGVDATFRVLRLETVRDIMIDIKNRNRGNLKEAMEQQLIGTTVMTQYNNRAYRIDAIDMDTKPTSTFRLTNRDNREISYVDYMLQQWDVRVSDINQPMLVHKPKPRRNDPPGEEPPLVYLIPELCCTTGLTDDMRSNFTIMKAIGEHTRLPPDIRESKLQEFLQQLATDQRATSLLNGWNLSVKPQLDVVDARRLNPENVMFGNQRSFSVPDNADWTRPATTGPVFKSVDVKSWVLMVTERDANIAEDFLKTIEGVSRQLGMHFSPPRVIKLPNDSPTTYVNAGKQNVLRTDQMVVIMTPGRAQREDRYSACKRLYSCEMPIPCQFIRCGTVSNPQKIRSICQKVVIQILSKVGGQPWAMKFPMKKFMIVGIDVYHDTIDRKKSCLGFVASMNDYTSQWWSHVFFQNSLEEIGQKINSTMVKAITKFHAINGDVPDRIIVYRDGTGDGQLATVLDVEIPQVLDGIKFYMRDDNRDKKMPDLSYIIVQKRINAKFGLRANNRCTNPLPGSYVDHTITHPDYNDFFLVSQHVNQGTVSPTKYIVLREGGNLKLDHHQKLAYKMTHMYYNWCGTIRVPAPCQYAHKLAYLCGQNIRQQPSDKLEDKLYYL